MKLRASGGGLGSGVIATSKSRVRGSTHHAAVILMSGRHLADQEFPATPDGWPARLDDDAGPRP
ncbi:hypothetical protein Misp02_54510 [Microtetraspora sp. NBRC 16547]|nr:hypothetical protein Misp02_54510 [Microtetraspora sp. NBRC 16547]